MIIVHIFTQDENEHLDNGQKKSLTHNQLRMEVLNSDTIRVRILSLNGQPVKEYKRLSCASRFALQKAAENFQWVIIRQNHSEEWGLR